MKAYGLTHVGNVRSTNEDAVLVERTAPPFYALVADGMGGHAAGEVASAIAASAVRDYIGRVPGETLDEDQIVDAIQYANRMIIDAIDEHPEYSGMGTTLTFAYLEPATLTIGHVGDSSAYLIGGGRIKKITRDHTYMQKLIDCGVLDEDEIDDFPLRNVITRALGSEPLQVDIYKERWLPGDRLLLCSDGLTAYADRDYLFRELTGDAEKFEDYALRLVDYALSEGGRDNISVIVIENTDEQGNAS